MPNDTTIPLSPAGVGGDVTDASVITQDDGATVKAERIVVRAEAEGHVLSQLEWRDGAFAVPVADPRVLARLDEIVVLLKKMNQTLARAHNLLP